MSPVTESPARLTGNIMIVDDNLANLKLLEEMLFQQGYEVRSFARGKLALTAAEEEPPDLMLLDINMPEMNGYQVCKALKASRRLSGLPVIFLSALSETEDKVSAFDAGGVDYVSKPFQFEEVLARVATHLKLKRAQEAEHELLEKTLGGAIGTLWQLVELTSPMVALRSRSVKDIVSFLTKKLSIPDPWQYELAATLCLLGCLTLPDDVFEKGYCREPLSAEDEAMFRAHPERAARLLANIPRLEGVTKLIRGQLDPVVDSPSNDPSGRGFEILSLALELDRRLYRGATVNAAVAKMSLAPKTDRLMLHTLLGYIPPQREYETRRMPVRDLRAGMILEKDVTRSNPYMLIMKGGTVLTDTWIERLQNFAQGKDGQELLDVRIPRIVGDGR